MSAFADILKGMVERVPGAVGAIFADWDGEAVDQFAHIPELDIKIAGAHWGVVLTLATESLKRASLGAIDELWIEGDHALVLVRRVTDRYYVVLTTGRATHLATARRELLRTTEHLKGEM